jgi:hypothetical protein
VRPLRTRELSTVSSAAVSTMTNGLVTGIPRVVLGGKRPLPGDTP